MSQFGKKGGIFFASNLSAPKILPKFVLIRSISAIILNERNFLAQTFLNSKFIWTQNIFGAESLSTKIFLFRHFWDQKSFWHVKQDSNHEAQDRNYHGQNSHEDGQDSHQDGQGCHQDGLDTYQNDQASLFMRQVSPLPYTLKMHIFCYFLQSNMLY